MPVITLARWFDAQIDQPVTVAEVAASIGAGLAKAALAGRSTACWWTRPIDRAATRDLAIVTDRDADGLEVLRHSTAHLLAQAVKDLFPDAQVTIGPVIENGFYYDFSYKRPFTPEDLPPSRHHGASSPSEDEPVSARCCDARRRYRASSSRSASSYKAEIIESIPGGEDLAVPPGRFHRPVPRPARAVDRQAQGLQADEGGRCLLARRLEERDAAAHLRHGLGEQGRPGRPPAPAGRGREARPPQARPQLDLFHLQDEAPGMVFWHPKGWAIWQQVEQYMRARLPGQRLPGNPQPADPRPLAVGEVRPLGQLPREHVHDGIPRTATTRSSR